MINMTSLVMHIEYEGNSYALIFRAKGKSGQIQRCEIIKYSGTIDDCAAEPSLIERLCNALTGGEEQTQSKSEVILSGASALDVWEWLAVRKIYVGLNAVYGLTAPHHLWHRNWQRPSPEVKG